MGFSEHETKTQIVASIFEKRAVPAAAIVPLAYQAPLAAVFLVLAAVFGGVFVSSGHKTALATAVATSLALSFGSIFLLNAVRVYTGAAAHRGLSSVRRAHPYVLTDLDSGTTEVALRAAGRVPLGAFATEHKPLLAPGFALEPNPRTEPEILVSKPSLFRENPRFWPQAAAVIKSHIHEDPTYNDLVAGETLTRYFHIYDLRLPPMYGRIPEVEDILGTVELDLGGDATRIVPGSFEPNAMYRPVTQYGAMLVSPFLNQVLSAKLGSA